jgi:predicted kinase
MLLGLMAPAGSGKSKVAKHLKRRYGFKRMHAGAPVKKAMRAGFGLDKSAVNGKGKERPNMALAGAKPRSVLEPVSDAIADHAPSATANALRPKLMRAINKGRHVVVDGVRQPAEAALIHKLGGKLVAIETGRMPDPEKPMDMRAAQLAPDHTINARGGTKKEKKAALGSAVDGLMNKMMGDWGE